MKKILIFLLFITFFMTSCSLDNDYNKNEIVVKEENFFNKKVTCLSLVNNYGIAYNSTTSDFGNSKRITNIENILYSPKLDTCLLGQEDGNFFFTITDILTGDILYYGGTYKGQKKNAKERYSDKLKELTNP